MYKMVQMASGLFIVRYNPPFVRLLTAPFYFFNNRGINQVTYIQLMPQTIYFALLNFVMRNQYLLIVTICLLMTACFNQIQEPAY